jgi:hypothetical protein
MKRLFLSLGLTSFLVVSEPCLAQPTAKDCFISQVQGGQMFSLGSMPNKLESFPRDAFVAVRCGDGSISPPGANVIRGTVRLAITRSFTYNGVVKMRLVGGSGIFSGLSPTGYSAAPIEVPYRFAGGFQEGQLFYQLQVTEPNSQRLEAAPNYSVSVNARLNKQL